MDTLEAQKKLSLKLIVWLKGNCKFSPVKHKRYGAGHIFLKIMIHKDLFSQKNNNNSF